MQDTIFLFSIFEVTYSLIFSFIGFFVSIWMLTRTVHEKKLSLKFLGDHIVLLSLFSLFMGRLGLVLFPLSYVITEKLYYLNDWRDKAYTYIDAFVSFWHGGLSFIWALGGFLFLFSLLCLIKNQSLFDWIDAFSLPVVFFLIFYFLGAFFSGQNHGHPITSCEDELSSNSFYCSISSYLPSVKYDMQTVEISESVHPLQIYGAFLFLLLFVLSWKFWRKSIEENWPNGIFGSVVLSVIFFILFVLDLFVWKSNAIYVIWNITVEGFIFLWTSLSILLFMAFSGHFWVFSRFKSKF